MFGKNAILKQELTTECLRVVAGSPFRTIQGEGPYAGYPAVFLRLHGCNLACTFCDTNFDDPNDPYVSPDMLVSHITRLWGPERTLLLVITGGEPFRQNILPLIEHFHSVLIQIETAGTLWIDGVEKHAKIVCSPKTPTIHHAIYHHACAFKYVIDCNDEHE